MWCGANSSSRTPWRKGLQLIRASLRVWSHSS
jgi:hypothetical protein